MIKYEKKQDILGALALGTVSAFLNYDGDKIFFGVDDNGNMKGLQDDAENDE